VFIKFSTILLKKALWLWEFVGERQKNEARIVLLLVGHYILTESSSLSLYKALVPLTDPNHLVLKVHWIESQQSG
jgi:CTP synthase (UTP-ammonia lyase)